MNWLRISPSLAMGQMARRHITLGKELSFAPGTAPISHLLRPGSKMVSAQKVKDLLPLVSSRVNVDSGRSKGGYRFIRHRQLGTLSDFQHAGRLENRLQSRSLCWTEGKQRSPRLSAIESG
jgi:hypothetical protein